MGRSRRKPASPQRLFPPCCHMNWDAGIGCRPGPSPTAWSSNLTEIHDDPPGCHYLLCLSPPELMLRELQNSERVSVLWYKSRAPGAGFSRGNEPHLSHLAFPMALLVGVTSYFCPLWILTTAFSQQFLKTWCSIDQIRCNRGSDIGGWR